MKFYLFLIVFYFFIIFINQNVNGADYTLKASAVPLPFNLASSWVPTGVPSTTDNVFITTLNDSCWVDSDITVKTITLNGATLEFIGASGTIGGNFLIDENSILILNSTTLTKTIAVKVGTNIYIDIYGNVLLQPNSKYIFKGFTYLNPNSIVNINGRLDILNKAIIDEGSYFYSNPSSHLYLSTSSFGLYGELKFNQSTFTSTNDLTIWDDGVINMHESTCYLSGAPTLYDYGIWNILSNSNISINTDLYVEDFSKLQLENSNYYQANALFNISNEYENCWFLYQTKNSLASFINSTVHLDGTMTALNDDSKLYLENSKFISNHTVALYNTSSINVTSDSYFECGFLSINDNTRFILLSSKVMVKDNYFASFESGYFETEYSEFEITMAINDTGIIGIFDNSVMYISLESKFYLDAVFIIDGDSILTIRNSSTFKVIDELYGSDTAIVAVRDRSKMEIYGLAYYDGDTYFIIENSELFINNDLELWDTSSFKFEHSQVTINGTFSFFNDYGATFHSEITNSSVFVNGIFDNDGILDVVDSTINININFTNSWELVMNSTNLIVEEGIFESKYTFYGFNSTVLMKKGIIHVQDQSDFHCENCTITILNGNLKQDAGCNLLLINTIFNNNPGGKIESDGDFVVDHNSQFTNEGDFILKANIIPHGNTQGKNVQNSGSFLINGNAPSNIKVGFVNNGTVSVEQGTNFNSYQQNSGSLSLHNGKKVTSNSSIEIQGGKVVGDGIIDTDVNSNGGTIGDKGISSLTINGNFSQSDDSQIILSINSYKSSKLNITNSAKFNGTLTVRIGEEFLNSFTETATKPLIAFNESSGNFSKIIIVTYDEKTGKETVLSDNNCKAKISRTDKSFGLLLNDNSDNQSQCENSNNSKNTTKKLSKGIIIGIVIGCIALVTIVGAVIFFRNKFTTHRIFLLKLKDFTDRSIKNVRELSRK